MVAVALLTVLKATGYPISSIGSATTTMNGSSLPQHLLGPSSLHGAAGFDDVQSSTDARRAASAGDPINNVFSAVPTKPSDIRAPARAANGTGPTDLIVVPGRPLHGTARAAERAALVQEADTSKLMVAADARISCCHQINQLSEENKALKDAMAELFQYFVEKKEQNDELQMLLHDARQLIRKRGDEVSELRLQLDRREEVIVVLKHQSAVYRLDFDAERSAREKKHAEAERLREQLEELQQSHQQLVDELEAYSIRHLDDMRRRHAQPAAAATAAATAPAATSGPGPCHRYGCPVSGAVSTCGISGAMSCSWPGSSFPSATVLSHTDKAQAIDGHEQPHSRQGGDTEPRSRPARSSPSNFEKIQISRQECLRDELALPETQFEIMPEAGTPVGASEKDPQEPEQQRLLGGYRLHSSPAKSSPEVASKTRPSHPTTTLSHLPQIAASRQAPSPLQQQLLLLAQPASQPPPAGCPESSRCPVCNVDLPDCDSMHVHVNECIDLHDAS